MGYNAPEWAIAFFGTIFANNVASGVYSTNIAEACYYQADHSEAQLIVVENEEHLQKYLAFIDKLPSIKLFVVYDDDTIKLKLKYKEHANMIMGWREFMELGENVADPKALKQ